MRRSTARRVLCGHDRHRYFAVPRAPRRGAGAARASTVDFLERENPGSISDELGDIVTSGDENLGDTATATYERELDQSLERRARSRRCSRSTTRCARSRTARYGTCEVCGNPIGAAGSRRSRGRGSASTTSARPTRERKVGDIRVGSSTDGLAPISVAERSLGCGCAPVGRAGARGGGGGRRRPGDEIRRHVDRCRSTTPCTSSVRFSIHHVQNTGIAFGLFSGATLDRRRRDRCGDRLDARVLRALRGAPPGAAGRVRARDRRQPLESLRSHARSAT